jgi:acyl-coenzyme A synthetase/AMP-(fatty) acid ligase
MIFQTSGSTGLPKQFEISDELLQARVDSRNGAKGSEFAALKSVFCDLSPQTTTAGRTYQLWAQKHGVQFFYQTGGSIESAWDLFQKQQIEGIIGQSIGLTNYALGVDSNPHRFKLVLTTGASLKPLQIPILQNNLGKIIISSYGASEVGTIATTTADKILATPGCVGKLAPGVVVEIDTTTTVSTLLTTVRTIPPPVSGLIKVKTTTMISGYTNPILTAKYFKDGWFYPGDMGYLTTDSILVLTGRAQGGF